PDAKDQRNRGKNQTFPHRPRRSPAGVNMPNATGMVGQLWCSVRRDSKSTHASALAGTGIPLRGPDHRGRRPFPMTDKQRNAPMRAKSPRSRSGVTHVKERLDGNFTVISNELLQHPELSWLAIGISCHIQSLPEGAPVSIKTLAAKMREGE